MAWRKKGVMLFHTHIMRCRHVTENNSGWSAATWGDVAATHATKAACPVSTSCTCVKAWQVRHPADLKQMLQVWVGCSVLFSPLNGCVCDVCAHKVPAVHGRAQQRVDEICSAPHIQHPHRARFCMTKTTDCRCRPACATDLTLNNATAPGTPRQPGGCTLTPCCDF